jgi:type IV pilus assembly protein PilC
MSLLTAAKSPLVQSLEMVSDMITFIPLKESVNGIGENISMGKTLHASVEQTGFFDRKFTSLIKAGEEVNKLDYSFNQLNEQYNQEIDHKLSILASLMEPLLILLVGGIVAVILIAMYLPLFQIGSSIY